jgi:two-component system, cell cycle response regulator DivK
MSTSLRRIKPLEPATRYPGRRHETAAQLKVLVVEDHDDTRNMLRTLLEMWGCRVVEASDGLKAVEVAQRERPAAILIDRSLPLLDGLAATRLIRANPLFCDITIIAVSGWDTPAFQAEALWSGCNACLTKPLDFEQLKSCLAPLLHSSLALV